MSEIKMLEISHIEPVGLIAANGPDLSTAFCNIYLVEAVNKLIDQDEHQARLFLGGVAGQALLHLFLTMNDLEQLDKVLSQIRTFVIQNVGS